MSFSLFRSSFIKLPSSRGFKFTPRYYDPEKEKKQKKKIQMVRGAIYKKSQNRLLGAFSSHQIAMRDKRDRGAQLLRMVFLASMMGVCVLYLIGKINGGFTFGILLILLLLFIKNVKNH